MTYFSNSSNVLKLGRCLRCTQIFFDSLSAHVDFVNCALIIFDHESCCFHDRKKRIISIMKKGQIPCLIGANGIIVSRLICNSRVIS